MASNPKHEETNYIKTETISVDPQPVSEKPKGKEPVTRLVGLNTTLFYRQKKSFAVATGVALSIVLAAALLVRSQIAGIEKELSRQALSILSQFPEKEAAQWLVRSRSERSDWRIESRFELQGIIKKITANRDVRYALIVDEKSQQIKGHSSENFIGLPYQSVVGEELPQERQDLIARRYQGEGKDRLIDFSFPVSYGQKEDKRRVGAVHFGIFSERLDSARQRGMKVLPLVSFLILLGAIASVVIKDKAEKRKSAPVLSSGKGRLGPYALERKIASGGMGELFVAVKESGGVRRRVAIKRILPEKASDEQVISSLIDEAALSSQLHHPNVVTLHDFGNIAGTYFIDMEYVEGVDLSAVMKCGRDEIEMNHALYIVTEVCKGLDYAHKKKDDFSGQPLLIVHRDISPTNILISFGGEVKITDFGIAKAAQRVTKNTATGIIKGKLYYLSPEQATGGEVDYRSDLFSLGLVFYELLAGKKAFPGETSHEILMAVARANIEPVGHLRKDLPEGLERIVMKSLAANPPQRQQSAGELLEEINALIRKYPALDCSREALADFLKGKFSKK